MRLRLWLKCATRARLSSTATRRRLPIRAYGIATLYQNLAAANLYLGREILASYGTAMEVEARRVMGRLNPNVQRFEGPVSKLSGGQRLK